MENYSVNTALGVVKIPISLSTDFDDQLKEQRKDTIVNQLLSSKTQDINDYEITAFKYANQSLKLDLYFYRECTLMIIDPPPGGQTNADYFAEYSCKGSEYVQNMLNIFRHPADANFPLFFNTFLHPFHNRQADWYIDGKYDKNRFEPNSYAYNSFVKMNFYTTPFSATQELLFENIVYANPRWCKKEGDKNGTWLRPTFELNKNTDGYYLYWLNKFDLNKDTDTDVFYVNFQFWNAAAGKLISFIPTVANTDNNLSDKRWVQSTNFDYRAMYLQCTVNYVNKTYSFQEFDKDTGEWSRSVDSLWLYELVFDQENKFVNDNPNYYVVNDECPSEAPPVVTTDFDILIHPNNDLSFSFDQEDFIYDSINGGTHTNFWGIRELLDWRFGNLTKEIIKYVRIENKGITACYLKDINIIVTEDGSDIKNRIAQISKVRHKDDNNVVYTTYICATIPTPSMCPQTGHTENTENFGGNYYINDFHYDDENTTATPNYTDPWYTSAERYNADDFPLTLHNFWDTKYSELLFITRKGTDLTPIHAGEILELTIRWGFDIANITYNPPDTKNSKYSETFVEPAFYGFIKNPEIFKPDPKMIYDMYIINLNYTVMLHFNDMDNTLSYDKNNYPLSGDLINANFKITYNNRRVKP